MDISGDGRFWKVQLDVRDLGGHLDFTSRARAGTLSERVGEDYCWVLLPLVLCLLGITSSFAWFVVSICPVALHAAQASFVSSSSISAFRAGHCASCLVQ